MKRLNYFIRTTLLGGLLVVLPIIILILVLNWMIGILTDVVEPITNILIAAAKLNYIVASAVSIAMILIVFFAFGLIIKTRIGKFTFGFFEENFLKKIPFYKIIKDTIIQLFGTQKNLFKGVALVDLYGVGNFVTAFITDEYDSEFVTVFVPSGPAPTAGFVYHVKREFVHKINYPLDQSMRTIISLGVGSKNLIEKYNKYYKTD